MLREFCAQFLEAEVLAWPTYLPDMSPTERVWDVLELMCTKAHPANFELRYLSVVIVCMQIMKMSSSLLIITTTTVSAFTKVVVKWWSDM